MKKIHYTILIFFAVVLTISCKKKENLLAPGTKDLGEFFRVDDFPGPLRAAGIAFSTRSAGYVGLGDDYPLALNDFYKYDAHGWTKIADFAGPGRRKAVAFALGDTGYVGLGYGDDGGWTTLQDFWKYDPSSNGWSRLNDFPYATDQAVSFVVNDTAYVLSGTDVYRYDPAADAWTERAAFPGIPREDASVFTLGSRAYMGTGFDGLNYLKDFWEYNPSRDTWTRKADFPGTSVSQAIGFNLRNYGFLGTGNDSLNSYDKVYRYDPSANSWITASAYPGGPTHSLVRFIIGDTVYLGLGSGSEPRKFYMVK